MQRIKKALVFLAVAFFILACSSNSGYETFHPQIKRVVLVNPTEREFSEFHLSIWTLTKDCIDSLDLLIPLEPNEIYWATADSLKLQNGSLAYGMTQMQDGKKPKGIILESPFWWNATILSHEMIHALTRRSSHYGPQWLCQIPLGTSLPLRRWKS